MQVFDVGEHLTGDEAVLREILRRELCLEDLSFRLGWRIEDLARIERLKRHFLADGGVCDFEQPGEPLLRGIVILELSAERVLSDLVLEVEVSWPCR